MSVLITKILSRRLLKYPQNYGIISTISKAHVIFRGLCTSESGVNLSIYENQETRVSPLWLRHHCQCQNCVHPSTHQRVLIPGDLRNSSTVKSVTLDKKSVEENIKIVWNDDHVSTYKIKWLQDNIGDNYAGLNGSENNNVDSTTDISEVSVNFDDFLNNNNRGLQKFMGHIQKFGFALIVDAPPDTVSTKKAIERIAQPQVTMFGGLYEFQSDLKHADTAYTSDYVHLHTDCTYFTEPNGLQVFHCLEHIGEGGINSVADGFKIAQEFSREYPDQYEILKSIPVPWHYIDPGKYSFYNVAPILQHNPYTDKLQCLRYNPHDMAPLNTIPLVNVSEFYESIINFSDKLEKKAVWFKLHPGMILFTDNWRVLHGRSEFTGSRKMCGSYITRSDWLSKFKVMFGNVQDGSNACTYLNGTLTSYCKHNFSK
ncbi:unnamed protein product [Allacma fusca]|uniref:Trimethyllysine dioxygenase, mitochondrial n=1 Tax=Allacma fusca TaxID=39272 RepID=A0A8J2P136_9HEXA|nr:unnamed protein product [Allacma fusca]